MFPLNGHQHKFDIYRADIVPMNHMYMYMYQFTASLDLFPYFNNLFLCFYAMLV